MLRRDVGDQPVARELPRLVSQPEPLHAREGTQRARDLGMYCLAHGFFRRTSSSGADHGYGLIIISAGSATRGPMPLGQMYW